MNRRLALIQALVSLVALAAVVWWASKQDAPVPPSAAKAIAWLVGGARALRPGHALIRGERWHWILASRTSRRTRRDCYALTTVGYMGNNVLPARAGEALQVVLLPGRSDASKRTLLGSVVAERLLDVIALVVIFVVVVYGVLGARRAAHRPADPGRRHRLLVRSRLRGCSGCCAATTSSSACATGCARWPTRRGRSSRARGRAVGRHLRALDGRGGRLLAVAQSVDLEIRHGRRPLPRGAHQLRRGAAGRAGLDRHVRRRGGLGGQPACATGSAAVSYLLMLRFVLYVPITLVGFVVLVTRYGGWSRIRSARSSTPRGGLAPPAPAAPRAERSRSASRQGRREARSMRDAASSQPAPARRRRSVGAGRPARPVERSHAAHVVRIIGACLALSAVTLLFPPPPPTTPWAWILWGREIMQLDLVTEGGPSWKPFPILFTTPFSLFGDDIAPYLWVGVARAGGLLGCVMAYRMATPPDRRRRVRGAGRRVARLALFSSNKYVRDAALGNSSRCWPRWCCGPSSATWTAAATTRCYLGFLPRCCARGVALPRPLRALALVRGAAAARAWLVPSPPADPGALVPARWWGSGDPFRAGARANAPNQGSAAFADIPHRSRCSSASANVTIAPVKSGTLIAVAYAAVLWIRRRARGGHAGVGRSGLAWFVLVAGMTEAGFAGNQRYLIVTAVVCVLGGMGAVRGVLQGVEWLAARIGSPRTGAAVIAGAYVLGVAGGLAHDRGQGGQHGARDRRARARGLGLARPQGPDRRGRGPGRAAGLQRHLQRPVPDADDCLRARYPRHPRGLEGDPAAGRGLPHPHGAGRAARDQAHRRPLPARATTASGACSRCRPRTAAGLSPPPSPIVPTAPKS